MLSGPKQQFRVIGRLFQRLLRALRRPLVVLGPGASPKDAAKPSDGTGPSEHIGNSSSRPHRIGPSPRALPRGCSAHRHRWDQPARIFQDVARFRLLVLLEKANTQEIKGFGVIRFNINCPTKQNLGSRRIALMQAIESRIDQVIARIHGHLLTTKKDGTGFLRACAARSLKDPLIISDYAADAGPKEALCPRRGDRRWPAQERSSSRSLQRCRLK